MVYILGLHNVVNEYSLDDMNLYNEYIEAKKNKDFAKSDLLRTKLAAKGII